MPALRRHRSAARPCPYPNGWLSSSKRRRHGRKGSGDHRGPAVAALPADVLSLILARASSGAADVARLASTCRRWGHVAATHAALICRALPPPSRYHTHLALGFFHQQHERVRAVFPSRRTTTAQPVFVPTASASRLLLGPGPGPPGLFDHARPVASRNGRVVLALRRRERGDGLTLSVWNPMTGDVSVLPAISGHDCPGQYYACALLTSEDLAEPPAPAGFFFRVLLVYNGRRRSDFTALRAFSSDTGMWGPEGRKPGPKMNAARLRRLGPAVVVRGVAYWPTHDAAFGVRLDKGASSATMDVSFVPYSISSQDYVPDYHVLGVSPDGSLSFVYATLNGLSIFVETLDPQTGQWERREWIDLPQVQVSHGTTAVKLRWFNEKSGAVLFTLRQHDGDDATSGAFMLNIATRSLEKLAGGVQCHGWRNVCGYEMDRAALLASTARF